MGILKFQKSSSFWLATFFTCLLVFSVAIILYFISLAYDAGLIRQTEAEINADIEMYQVLNDLGGNEDLRNIIIDRILGKQDRYFYNYSPKNNQDTQIANVNWPEDVQTLKEGIIQFQDQNITIIAKIMTFENGDELLVGRNIEYIEDTQDIVTTLGISIIIILFIISIVAYLVSVYVVNLINKISETANDVITSGDLSQRIHLTHDRDDLSKLGILLNSMFARIEQLVAGIRQVSDNIAHDLRTPLSRLRNKLEGFDGSEEHKQELIHEADTLINIFNALLRIARIEAGKETVNAVEVNIAELLADVVDFYQPLAEEKSQELKLEAQEIMMNLDKDLIFQALANLIDNAIKFTPKGGKVSIEAAQSKNQLSIKISDTGCGIAKQDYDKIFDRFYRAESSRTSKGHGLGLSLVQAVVKAHDGAVQILDSEQGLMVEIKLPVRRW